MQVPVYRLSPFLDVAFQDVPRVWTFQFMSLDGLLGCLFSMRIGIGGETSSYRRIQSLPTVFPCCLRVNGGCTVCNAGV